MSRSSQVDREEVTSSNLEFKTRTSTEEFFFEPKRTLQWLGGVNYGNLSDLTADIVDLLKDDPKTLINLVVTSPGGQTGIAMSFYDSMKSIYKPNLRTIGSGDVDSSGIIIFLTGRQRLITPHTTMLLHLAGRTLEGAHRFSSEDLSSMQKEDQIKDYQYASIIAERSGKLSPNDVLELMRNNTVLSAAEAVDFGLAHAILH